MAHGQNKQHPDERLNSENLVEFKKYALQTSQSQVGTFHPLHDTLGVPGRLVAWQVRVPEQLAVFLDGVKQIIRTVQGALADPLVVHRDAIRVA